MFWVAHLPCGSSEFLGVNGAYSNSKRMSATSVFAVLFITQPGKNNELVMKGIEFEGRRRTTDSGVVFGTVLFPYVKNMKYPLKGGTL